MPGVAQVHRVRQLVGVDHDLEGLGYLQRTPDPQDRRAKLVQFTARGRRSRRRREPRFGELEASLAGQAGPAETRRLRRTLLALIDTPLTRDGR